MKYDVIDDKIPIGNRKKLFNTRRVVVTMSPDEACQLYQSFYRKDNEKIRKVLVNYVLAYEKYCQEKFVHSQTYLDL